MRMCGACSRAMSECGRSDGRRSLDEPPAGWLPAPGARHMPKHHPGFQAPIDLSVEGVKRCGLYQVMIANIVNPVPSVSVPEETGVALSTNACWHNHQ